MFILGPTSPQFAPLPVSLASFLFLEMSQAVFHPDTFAFAVSFVWKFLQFITQLTPYLSICSKFVLLTLLYNITILYFHYSIVFITLKLLFLISLPDHILSTNE